MANGKSNRKTTGRKKSVDLRAAMHRLKAFADQGLQSDSAHQRQIGMDIYRLLEFVDGPTRTYRKPAKSEGQTATG